MALIILLIVSIKIFFGHEAKKEFLIDSTFCNADEDCALYRCVNCGNKLWIEENDEITGMCENKVPGLVGCECADHVCKRKYER